MSNAKSVMSKNPGHDVELSDASVLANEPLVSVVVLTYNHAEYIREALDSILMQRVDFPYEICIGEDQSTDGTREICLEYARQHPDRIRLFLRDRSNPDRQRYKIPFMQNGIETHRACRGKYIALLEGDDCWTSSLKLSRQIEFLEKNPSIHVCAHYAVTYQEHRPERMFAFPPWRLSRFDAAFFFRHCFFLATCSLVYRRGDWPEQWLVERAEAGDTLWTAVHLQKGGGAVLPYLMSMYRMHRRGASSGAAGYVPAEANLRQWELFRVCFPTQYRQSIQLGYCKLLSNSIRSERRSHRFGAALGYMGRLLRELATVRGAGLMERAALGLYGLVSLVSPLLADVIDAAVRRLRFPGV